MDPTKAYFSFSHLSDVSKHNEYNRWHLLDHRPENLALDGVHYGERWVHSPRCQALGRVVQPVLAATEYITTYWFTAPAEVGIVEWQALAERSFQWGRRPDRPYTARPLQGFFSCDQTYVSPYLSLSPVALKFRPSRSVYVVAANFSQPHSDNVQELYHWYDATAIPDALRSHRAVSGVCTFSSDSSTLDEGWSPVVGTTTFDAGAGERGQIRTSIYFLDEDAEDANFFPPLSGQEFESILFAGALEPIRPEHWDWFEGSSQINGE